MKASLHLPVLLVAYLLLTTSATNSKAYSLGDTVENFSLKSVEDDTVSLYDYQNENGVIIVFTCNHCPFAQLYEQRIIDLHNRYSPRGFPVIAINPNSPIVEPEDSFEKMQERAKTNGYPFAYLVDDQQTVAKRFEATRTPQVFILDNNFRVRYIGGIDSNAEAPSSSTARWAENAVNALLRGEKPNPETTKTVGCTIKKAPGATSQSRN